MPRATGAIDPTRLQALFAAAVNLPASERDAFLRRSCGDESQLLLELRTLLDADARVDGMTARPLLEGLGEVVASFPGAASLTGLRVGPFELREELGRGGMGRVHRAERVDGVVTQVVAIKFLRRELLDAHTLARFQLERRLLASLDHPCIARLIDAAELPDGTPCYVMEYVEGVPIDAYCRERAPDLRERVALMRRVCGAVAHAHRQLIVHRDLKPANLLITADGIPKLLDFGIAKPLSLSTHASDDTGTAQRFFSPRYAAPEQLRGDAVGVACDVYALGLLLYEVLCGQRPFEFDGLSAGQAERLILEVPPRAPSDALAQRPAAASIAARQLRGDLDGIVLRCLRKAPAERYASVDQLEADLANYLDGRPVLARGGHRWYRAQKFVRRNALGVVATAVVAISLLAGLLAFAWQARIARQRAADLQDVSEFQAGLLRQLDPSRAGMRLSENVLAKVERELTAASMPDSERIAQLQAFRDTWRLVGTTDVARDLLVHSVIRPAAASIGERFGDQPLVEAELLQVVAEGYSVLGRYAEAEAPQRRALELRRKHLGAEHPDTLRSMTRSGMLHWNANDPARAEAILIDALARHRRALGDDHEQTLGAMNDTGFVLSQQHKLAQAEPLYREALERRTRRFGAEHPDTLTSANNLASLLMSQGRLAEAEPLFLENLKRRRRVLGESDLALLSSISNVALVYQRQARLAEAEPYFRETWEKYRLLLGEEHPESLQALTNYAASLHTLRRYAESEAQFRRAVEIARRVLGRSNPTTLLATQNLAESLYQQGRSDEAAPMLFETLELSRRVQGDEHPDTLRSLQALARYLESKHRFADALDLLAPNEARARDAFAKAFPARLANYLASLGRALAARGDFATAETRLLEAHEILATAAVARPELLRAVVQSLADFYQTWNAAEPTPARAEGVAVWRERLRAIDAAAPPAS